MRSYVESQLSPGEEIVHVTRLHWAIFIKSSLIILLGLVIVLGFDLDILDILGMVIAGVGLLFLLEAAIRRATSEFAVTNHRVLVKVGLIRRRTIETMIQKVEGVQVDQGILGRILGWGTIEVTGTGGTVEPFSMIARPIQFRVAVQKECSKSQAVTGETYLDAISQVRSSRPDSISELERLAKLRESGALTEEEFHQEKMILLSRD